MCKVQKAVMKKRKFKFWFSTQSLLFQVKIVPKVLKLQKLSNGSGLRRPRISYRQKVVFRAIIKNIIYKIWNFCKNHEKS